MPDWQPIDTAPIDGYIEGYTILDLWVRDRRSGLSWRVADARHYDNKWHGWDDDLAEWRPFDDVDVQATHWMRVEGPVVDDSPRAESPVDDDSPRIMEGLER